MTWTIWITLGALFAAAGVAMGTLGGHVMRNRLSGPASEQFAAATTYLGYHGLALLAVGFVALRLSNASLTAAGVAFTAGTLTYSGGLYLRCFIASRTIEYIAALGAALLVSGWLAMAFAVYSL